MTEGDLIISFSQYGEIVDCKIVRDKETGKSKGFGFLCYEDQRSTILAVDNLNGANLCGRVIRVDHVEQYKIPREYFEINSEGDSTVPNLYKPTGPDGKGWGEDRIQTEEEINLMQQMMNTHAKQIEIKEHLDEDENWEREFLSLVNSKKEEEEKLKKEKAERKLKKKAKKAKKEAKIAKKEKKKKLKEEELSQILKNNYS